MVRNGTDLHLSTISRNHTTRHPRSRPIGGCSIYVQFNAPAFVMQADQSRAAAAFLFRRAATRMLSTRFGYVRPDAAAARRASAFSASVSLTSLRLRGAFFFHGGAPFASDFRMVASQLNAQLILADHTVAAPIGSPIAVARPRCSAVVHHTQTPVGLSLGTLRL